MWFPSSQAFDGSGMRLQPDSVRATRLELSPHFDDADQTLIQLIWGGSRAARMEPPDDEAIRSHRLFDVGLHEVSWLGESARERVDR
jgi:hypothetical protein